MSDPDGPVAPGAPGIAPTWSSGDKDVVGMSHHSNPVWFTIGRGILGFIVADDTGFRSEVKRDATHAVRYEAAGVPRPGSHQ